MSNITQFPCPRKSIEPDETELAATRFTSAIIEIKQRTNKDFNRQIALVLISVAFGALLGAMSVIAAFNRFVLY